MDARERKERKVCQFYLQGKCIFGEMCQLEHPGYEQPTKRHTLPSESTGAIAKPSWNTSWSEEERKDFKFTKLRKIPKIKEEWALAPVFKPKTAESINVKSSHSPSSPWQPLAYSDVARSRTGLEVSDSVTPDEARLILCPYASHGVCEYRDECMYLHGDMCDMCGRQCLHPYDEGQRSEHFRECLAYHEKEMEAAFAFQRSENKKCSVCMEVVLEKPKLSDRRFGILTECDHVFCLSCIREWRGVSHQEKETIRTCPICRKCSYFVIPSSIWIESGDEKVALIEQYKSNLRLKPCSYFNMGEGTCPFGSSCFYRHAYPDGTLAEIKFRKAQTSEGNVKAIQSSKLWDFIEARNEHGETS